jgi:hypothetical protein
MKTMISWRAWVLSLAILVLLLPCAASADLLWAQPPDLSLYGGDYISCTYYSSWTADDFQLNSSSQITGLSWQGGTLGGEGTVPPNVIGFNVTFYTDTHDNALGFHRPSDTPIVSYSLGNFTQSADPIISGSWYYSYGADLPSPVTVAANTTYWVSVQAVTVAIYNEEEDEFVGEWWGWHPSTTHNLSPGVIYSGAFSEQAKDLSMQLYGNPVPLPPSVLLLGSGLLGLLALGGRRRRRRD